MKLAIINIFELNDFNRVIETGDILRNSNFLITFGIRTVSNRCLLKIKIFQNFNY